MTKWLYCARLKPVFTLAALTCISLSSSPSFCPCIPLLLLPMYYTMLTLIDRPEKKQTAIIGGDADGSAGKGTPIGHDDSDEVRTNPPRRQACLGAQRRDKLLHQLPTCTNSFSIDLFIFPCTILYLSCFLSSRCFANAAVIVDTATDAGLKV